MSNFKVLPPDTPPSCPRNHVSISVNTCFHLSNDVTSFCRSVHFFLFVLGLVGFLRLGLVFRSVLWLGLVFWSGKGLVFVISWWNLFIEWRHVSLAIRNKWCLTFNLASVLVMTNRTFRVRIIIISNLLICFDLYSTGIFDKEETHSRFVEPW